MAENEFEHGLMHGEHTMRFYVLGALVLIVVGAAAGVVLAPSDWHPLRSVLGGSLTGLLMGFCVFAWHMLLGTVEEQ